MRRELNRYLERRLTHAEDPLSLVARLAHSELFDDYVAYEIGGTWLFAGGCLADLRMGSEVAELHCGSAVHRRARGDNLEEVEDLLSRIPVEGWTAYGWGAFELADRTVPDRERDLLHLIVPQAEVRIADGHVRLKATDERLLEQLAELVRSACTSAPGRGRRIDVVIDDDGTFRAAVSAAVHEIRSGALEKVVLARVVPVSEPVDLVASFVAGRRANTPARSFLLDLGSTRAAGFSPETIAEVSAEGTVTTRPLAGTRARTGHAHTDARLRAELLRDDKEISEHAMSIKLACEELGSVCNDVRIEDFMTVKNRGSVQHLASTAVGVLGQGHTPWQALSALFPAVTATGIPKEPAYRLIRQLETGERGLYAGTVLTCDHRGRLDAALVLRSIFQQDETTWLQAGAGIVAQSRPDREYEETCEKLRSVSGNLIAGSHANAG